MEDYLTTQEVSWLLGVSPGAVRRMIREGKIEGLRMTGGFRIPRDDALRLSRERIETEAGRKVSDKELARLIDEVITTNEAKLNES